LSPFSRDRGPGKGQEHGTTLRQLQQIMAESELATLRSRIIPGLFTAARQGVRGGHTPMGYHRLPDGRFVIDPALGPVVADAFRAVANGERPTTLLKQITAAGHRRCDGKPISPEQLRHLLRNRFYRGELLYRPVAAAKVISDASSVCLIGHHPALVDEVTFRLVQDRLAAIRSAYQAKRPRTRCSPQTAAPAETAWQELGRNAVDRAREQVRQRGRRIHGIVPPLIATCARCGSRCYCTLQTRGSRGSRYRVPIYLCETHKQYGNAACDQPPALGAEIDAAVEDALRQAITGGRFQSWQPPVLPPLVEGLQAELAEVEKRIERLQKAVAAHARLRGRLDALLAERDDLIARRDRQRTLRRVPSGPRWDSLRDFDGTWSTLDLAQRRDVVGWLVERVGIEDRGLIDISWVAAPMASLTSAPGGGPEEAA
ncbi:MAG: recombinase family protein, partial [Planctomycetota bacterium]